MMAAGEDHGFIAQQMEHADIGVTLNTTRGLFRIRGLSMGQNWKRRMQLLRLNDTVFGEKMSLNCHIKYKLLINQGVKWCGRRDSNSHTLRHWNLNPACLPISPRPLNQLRPGLCSLYFFCCNVMGWTMGFEPTTTGITIRGSTN